MHVRTQDLETQKCRKSAKLFLCFERGKGETGESDRAQVRQGFVAHTAAVVWIHTSCCSLPCWSLWEK